MADEKLKRYVLKLQGEFTALKDLVATEFARPRPIARNGTDGVDGDKGDKGDKGDPGDKGDTGDSITGAPGRDGRDGTAGAQGIGVTKLAVEDNLLSVWIGDVKTLAGRIMVANGADGKRGAKGDKGDKGDSIAGKDGRDGKDGKSVTSVKLVGRELFVWIEGVKKKAGTLTMPTMGGGGGGGRGEIPWNDRIVTDAQVINAKDMAEVRFDTTTLPTPTANAELIILQDHTGPVTIDGAGTDIKYEGALWPNVVLQARGSSAHFRYFSLGGYWWVV